MKILYISKTITKIHEHNPNPPFVARNKDIISENIKWCLYNSANKLILVIKL